MEVRNSKYDLKKTSEFFLKKNEIMGEHALSDGKIWVERNTGSSFLSEKWTHASGNNLGFKV